MKIRIYYHHTDCGGVVYYAKYLNFLEEARTEFFAERGFPIKELADKGILFVVARQEIDYKAPAFYGDILEVDTSVSKAGAVKIEFEHKIKNQDNRFIAQAKTIMVCVDNGLKPKAMPQEVRAKLLGGPKEG